MGERVLWKLEESIISYKIMSTPHISINWLKWLTDKMPYKLIQILFLTLHPKIPQLLHMSIFMSMSQSPWTSVIGPDF